MDVRWYEGVEEDVESLPRQKLKAKIYALVDRIAEENIPLQSTTYPNLRQVERTVPEGGLRILVANGKGCRWVIGVFVKHNDKEGNKLLAKLAPRALEVKDRPPT